MSDLEIHAYNVGFGDAILVRIPKNRPSARTPFRDILIDCGNSLMGKGGDDTVLLKAMEDIHKKTKGKLDLYIMTHEHMDHVQGLQLLKQKTNKEFSAKKVWMTASSEPDYYETHEDARKRFSLAQEFLGFANSLPADELHESNAFLRAILAINNPRRTADCVQLIREGLAGADKISYLHANEDTAKLTTLKPFREASFDIWGPEEDTSVYYGRLQHLNASGVFDPAKEERHVTTQHQPPRGVSLSEFNRLVAAREQGLASNALMIDKAANNSSIVFMLNWKGRKLLFSGDAEEKSWHFMEQRNLLEPVDFLKVSHHGSHNGTPDKLFETVLKGRDNERPIALVSTAEGQYNGVPQDKLMTKIANVADLKDCRDADLGKAMLIRISPQ